MQLHIRNRLYRFEKKLRSALCMYLLRIFLWITGMSIIFIAGRFVGLNMYKESCVNWPPLCQERNIVSCPHDIDYRKYIVSQLKIAEDALGENASLDVTRALENVMKILDPQVAIKLHETSSPSTSTPLYAQACGEIYDKPAPPFFRSGFIKDPKCDPSSKPSLETLVTILLLAPRSVSSCSPIDRPLIRLRQLYPRLKSIVATDCGWNRRAESNMTEVVKVQTWNFEQPGSLWNLLVQKVNTPYVQVARGVEIMDELARLQRLVFILSTTRVVVAGGAIRHASGRWRAGCLQTQLRNYALRMRRGYRYSTLDCMLCDHLEGPFLTRTDFLRQVPLHNNLPASVVFEDWFLRVKRRNVVVSACPDSLFFLGESEREPIAKEELQGARRYAWRQLAKIWQLNLVVPAGRQSLHFTCEEVCLHCDLRKIHNMGLLVPPCCLEKIEEVLKAFDDFTRRHGLSYEVSEGTLLGAVKLGAIMPWDNDADLFIRLKDFFTYISEQQEMSKLGHKFLDFKELFYEFYVEKYFTIFSKEIQVDVWGIENLTVVALPEEMQKNPTKVEINGFWFPGTWNPGLVARNRYGPDYLKHALSWRRLGMASHTARYRVGAWGNCSLPMHHSCLNRYPTEGSFDFEGRNR